MKVLINNPVFGDKEFPYKKVVSLCLGSFGDFQKPYYHKVLCAEYINENGMHHYEIIGEYFHKFVRRKYLLFGKKLSVTLFEFKTSYKKEEVENLIKNKDLVIQ